MDTYKEILEKEIAALDKAYEIIENGAGDRCEVSHILSAIIVEKKSLEVKIEDWEREQIPKLYEPEFDKYDKY